MFFFRARAGKGIAWHIDESSVVWTLIYHGKLANQIARLAMIVVKKKIYSASACLVSFSDILDVADSVVCLSTFARKFSSR